MKRIMFVTTTSTFANKGSSRLARHNIRSEVKRIGEGTAAGCLFGISVSANDLKTAEKILQDSGIRIISLRDDN